MSRFRNRDDRKRSQAGSPRIRPTVTNQLILIEHPGRTKLLYTGSSDLQGIRVYVYVYGRRFKSPETLLRMLLPYLLAVVKTVQRSGPN